MRGRTRGRWYVALRDRAEVAGHADKAALRFLHRPPTELADGFGREAALPTPDDWPGAGFTPVLRWVPGSPVALVEHWATRRRPHGLPGWGCDDRTDGAQG